MYVVLQLVCNLVCFCPGLGLLEALEILPFLSINLEIAPPPQAVDIEGN